MPSKNISFKKLHTFIRRREWDSAEKAYIYLADIHNNSIRLHTLGSKISLAVGDIEACKSRLSHCLQLLSVDSVNQKNTELLPLIKQLIRLLINAGDILNAKSLIHQIKDFNSADISIQKLCLLTGCFGRRWQNSLYWRPKCH